MDDLDAACSPGLRRWIAQEAADAEGCKWDLSDAHPQVPWPGGLMWSPPFQTSARPKTLSEERMDVGKNCSTYIIPIYTVCLDASSTTHVMRHSKLMNDVFEKHIQLFVNFLPPPVPVPRKKERETNH